LIVCLFFADAAAAAAAAAAPSSARINPTVPKHEHPFLPPFHALKWTKPTGPKLAPLKPAAHCRSCIWPTTAGAPLL